MAQEMGALNVIVSKYGAPITAATLSNEIGYDETLIGEFLLPIFLETTKCLSRSEVDETAYFLQNLR